LQAIAERGTKAAESLKNSIDSIKSKSPKGPYGEARSALVKLKVKAGAIEQKCKRQSASLLNAHKEVGLAARKTVIGALMDHVQKNNVDFDSLFGELSTDGQPITVANLRAYIEKNVTSLTSVQLDLGLDAYQSGLTKLGLQGIMQEYYRVVKEIAITTAFNVKDSKTLRKLEVGELVQILESGKEDIGLPRLRCRALTDLKEGWVTEKGNQGTLFLEKVAKPYFYCQDEIILSKAFESHSAELRKMQPGEVLEVFEGPRKEPPVEVMRARGKAQKDGKMGWVTFKDAGGELFELTSFLTCKQSIAITTTFDIAAGKALRKLDVGELLEIIEAPKEDSARSLTRVKVRARNDANEGYVTMKGNQGTAYVEEASKLYKCVRSTPFELRYASGSQAIRTLEQGEAFEVSEGPKAETKQGANRVRGKVLSDNSAGWFTLSKKNVQPWSPHYMCKTTVNLEKDVDTSDSAESVCSVEMQEVLEALECPVRDKAGVMRVKLRSPAGNVGFATIKNEKQVFLEPVFVEL